jgi:hypothetical protein
VVYISGRLFFQPYSGNIKHKLATVRALSFSRIFHGIEEIKHNLAETSEINHNLAKNSGRAVWLRDRMRRLAFGRLRAR